MKQTQFVFLISDKPPVQFTVPVHPYSFPELASMTKEDLQMLNDNPDQLEEFVCSLKQSQEYNRAIETRIEDVELLAKDNLAKQGKLEKLKKRVSHFIFFLIKFMCL